MTNRGGNSAQDVHRVVLCNLSSPQQRSSIFNDATSHSQKPNIGELLNKRGNRDFQMLQANEVNYCGAAGSRAENRLERRMMQTTCPDASSTCCCCCTQGGLRAMLQSRNAKWRAQLVALITQPGVMCLFIVSKILLCLVITTVRKLPCVTDWLCAVRTCLTSA